ncbi:hypothetical protein [Gorillibacterium massiliense]|nr:hypothetical protein [Gorillibacterium massiliense]
MLMLIELTKKYGILTAVDHISLSIGKGEIVGLQRSRKRHQRHVVFDR